MQDQASTVKVVECNELPESPDLSVVYRLLPVDAGDGYYWERVDRNMPWITKDEQEILRSSVVGVAGCGGMGGAAAERLLRMGVGEVRFADGEAFDVSNIHRQLGAMRGTVGQNKALAQARVLRRVTNDSTLAIYPHGICAEIVEHFVSGCDVICDEIEFWELTAAMHMHQAARKAKVSIFGCNTVGWGTHLFYFPPGGMNLIDAFGFSWDEAEATDRAMHEGTMPFDAKKRLMERLIRVVVPLMQDYAPKDSRANLEAVRERVIRTGNVPILTPNPAFATGFLVDRVLLYLLRNSGVQREIAEIPPFPGYYYLDAAKMMAEVGELKLG